MRLCGKIFGLLFVCVMTISSSSAMAAIIYTVDLPPMGDLTLQGTITTDGNTGTVTSADVLDWDLTVSSASLSYSLEFLGPGHGSALNSTLELKGYTGYQGPTATATTLFLPYPSAFDLESSPRCGNASCGHWTVTPSAPGYNTEYTTICNAAGACDGVEIGLSYSGVQLADAGVVLNSDNQGDNNQGNDNDQGNGDPLATPLPATLPLFATGIGALGLLGWRRKRKAVG
jgi:hypothetical protein